MGHYASEMFVSDKEHLHWAEVARDRLAKELAARPTTEAYEAACKALAHWRKEAKRLGKIAGVTPREMKQK